MEMVQIDCPWCQEGALLPFVEFDAAETTFDCPDCGTTVAIVDDVAGSLDLAA